MSASDQSTSDPNHATTLKLPLEMGDQVSNNEMASPPRVLQVAGSMNRGGAETMLMNVYRAMDRSRLQFDFVEFSEQTSQYRTEIMDLGGRILTMPPPAKLGARRALFAYSGLIRGNGPYRAVHAHILHGSALPLIAARNERVPVRIAHSHNTGDRGGFQASGYQRLARLGIRFAATDLVACGTEAGEYLFGVQPPTPVQVINNGIDVSTFCRPEAPRSDHRNAIFGASRGPLIGCVARLEPVKNHRFLIELADELRQDPVAATFLFIGDGSLRNALEAEVQGRGLDDAVRFLGVRTDMPEILDALDAVVLPSHHEGVPVSLIEAQATGLPCLVSRNVVPSVDMGLGLVKFLDSGDIGRWVTEIQDLARRQGRERVSVDARRAALTARGYSVEATVLEFMRLYGQEP